jgi:hypothetical protein
MFRVVNPSSCHNLLFRYYYTVVKHCNSDCVKQILKQNSNAEKGDDDLKMVL